MCVALYCFTNYKTPPKVYWIFEKLFIHVSLLNTNLFGECMDILYNRIINITYLDFIQYFTICKYLFSSHFELM